MLIGLDGTVGSADSLKSAIKALGISRISAAWRELNAPIPMGKYVSNPKVQATAQTAGTAANLATRLMPGGMVMGNTIPALSQQAVSGVSRHFLSAGIATLEQVQKVFRVANHGSISEIQNTDHSVKAERQVMKSFGFIHQLVKNVAGTNIYFDGPTTLGAEDNAIIGAARSHVVSNQQILKSEPLIIAGYSRGGLNAAQTARLLARDKIAVDLLILLDPVDRDPNVPSESSIPENVKRVILIGRSGYLKYTRHTYDLNMFDLKLKITYDLTVDLQSRWWFGRMISKDDLEKFSQAKCHEIDCTHAAHGGLPWLGDTPAFLTEKQDRELARQVAKVLSIFLWQCGQSDPAIRLNNSIKLLLEPATH